MAHTATILKITFQDGLDEGRANESWGIREFSLFLVT